MNIIFCVVLIIMIMIILIYQYNENILSVYYDDLVYYTNSFFYNDKKKFLTINYDMIQNMPLTNQHYKIKLLIISCDDRKNIKYLEIHNKNIGEYSKKYNVDYKFITNNNLDNNIYWNKLYLIKNQLDNNFYDYIMWLDTDVIIINQNIDILNILYNYDSDIYIGSDNNIESKIHTDNILCAGVFIIKNSVIGKKFINECISFHENDKSICLSDKNILNGMYAGLCYEQGVMNYLIYNKYFLNTILLDNSIIMNTDTCVDNKNIFILHFYGNKLGSTEEQRIKCFEKYF